MSKQPCFNCDIIDDFCTQQLIAILEEVETEIQDIKGDSIDFDASDYRFGRYQGLDIAIGVVEDKIGELKNMKIIKETLLKQEEVADDLAN